MTAIAAPGEAGGSDASRREQNVLVAAKGSGFLAGGSLFEFATRFLIALLLARMLGAGEYGLYVIAISVATVFSGIAALGLDDAMVRYVAILSGRRDRPGVWGTIQVGIGVAGSLGVLVGGALFVLAEPIAEGLFDEPDLTPLLRLFAVVVPFLTISNVLAGTAKGFHRMDYTALAENVVMSLVRLVLLAAVAVALQGMNVYAASVVFGISDVAATITFVVLLNRHFPVIGVTRPVADRHTRELFSFSLPLWLSGLLRQFRRNIQTLLLGTSRSSASVGVFAIVDKVNLVGHVALLSLFMAVKPTLARLHDRGDHAGLSHLYVTATRWALTLTVPFFLVSVLYPEAILAVFGDSFTAGATALVVMAFAEIVNAGTGICGPVIDMTGHTRAKLFNSVVLTVLLIGCNALFIPPWGVLGSALAFLVGTTVFNALCVAQAWYLERLWPFDRTFWKPVVAGAAACAAGFLLLGAAPVGTDTVAGMVQGSLVCALYLGLVVAFGLPAEERLVLERAARKVLAIGRRWRGPIPVAGPSTAVRAAVIADPVGPLTDQERPPERDITDPPNGPIYIGGLERSGKTTLAAFLTSHPRIAVPDFGTNMWTYFYRRHGDLRDPRNLDRCLDAMLRYSHVARLDPDRDRIRTEFATGPRTYARLFSLFLDHYAHRRGKPRWGVQTGLVERYASQILAADPAAVVIHLVRDPRDRYEAALGYWPSGRGRAGAATARWKYSLRLAERHRRRHPDRYLVVRYEDLVLDTESTLRHVCAFIGEDYHEAMLAMPGAPERRDRLRARVQRPSGEGPLSPEFIGRFVDRIPAEELAFVQLHAGRRMRRLGYEPVPVGLDVRGWARFAATSWPNQFGRMVAWRAMEAAQQRFPNVVARRPDPKLIVEHAGVAS
ncbi:MAG: hypothetical protein KatS3mg010_1118 [Acidimicrobiia bacterium]|nr:MAG: hypothetical protein KatS3mg010_1118 [Acidimicrobiia bacterium]